MADPNYVRIYEQRLAGLKGIVARDSAALADAAQALARRLKDGTIADSSDARALATTAQRLVETLARIEILEEVSYLTDQP